MMSGKAQASQQPTAMGSMLQAATYGLPIPVIYGITQSPLLVIWAQNLRQGGSTKKFKQLKKGITSYVENIDFLLGKNPILGVLQMWANGGKYPLNIVTFSTGYKSNGQICIPNCSTPDPNFYAVIAVTVEETYSETFNDYGNPNGSQTVSGTWERPLWNQLLAGPDPTDASYNRYYPYVYHWEPSYGPVVWVDSMADGPFGVFSTFKVYYAQLTSATSNQPPITRLRLSFENILGSGTEYADFPAEQIQYPWYAGLGSSEIDLGSTGAIPQLNAEVQGKYSLYPTGDGDFADMIEDVAKSGITQTALGGFLNFGPTEHGVGCYDFPGAIQKKYVGRFETTYASVAFDMPNAAGNILVAYVDTGNISPGLPVITDSLGNTWTLRASHSDGAGSNTVVYTCENCKAGGNTISWTNEGFYGTTVFLFELPGQGYVFDAADYIETGVQPSVSVTTTNSPGQPAILLGLSWNGVAANTNLYPIILQSGSGAERVQLRNVTNPGTYTLTATGGVELLALIAWKATQPQTYPNPLPNFLEPTSLALTRLQCRAAGLWGSLSMNSQKTAREWLQDFYQAANAVPVMSGFSVKSIPYSEVSAAGNGAVYTAPTAAGPVAELSVDNGDFICSKDESPIVIERSARTDLNTVVQMQHINRSSDYQQVITAVSDAASILKYGVRKADPIVNNAIQDVSVARMILQIMVRDQNYVKPTKYKFKLPARWQLLEAMDLITITDTLQGINQVPVRLTSMVEDDKYTWTAEAEPFMYGVHAPGVTSVDQPQPYSPVTNTSAGNVNTPVIFEPVPRLYAVQNQAQLWIVVSSSATNYGGAQVFISTDGGASYNLAGDPLVGSAITGVSTADWPAASSPDTTNDLALDLTESNGELASYQTSDEDNFLYPCYMAGGGAFTIPYELMTYAVATLTATNKYTLKATGGNHLNRGVFGAPSPATGVDHPTSSRFAFLDPSGAGILKLNMDPTWIGKTLHFKICSFNTFGSALQALSSVTDYTYTPTGAPGAVNSGGIPVQGFQVNGA